MASHPTKIGKYDVEDILGEGGMGVVYKAFDKQIGRPVAIKMIRAGGDESLVTRFKQEAKSLGQLTHPNIVIVYEWDEQDGNPYLVMQYIEGSSLASMLEKGISLPLSERLKIIIDVCNGLAYAHQRKVIHRDIKPGNIMVWQDGGNDGKAVIVDFGIAKIEAHANLTGTKIIGSFHYMAKEQYCQEEIDNRTDIYAVGVVLFQLITGALPFDAPDADAMKYQVVYEPPPPLSKYLKGCPADLEAIVSRTLAKNREDRYPDANELAFDLAQVRERLKSKTVEQLLRRVEPFLERGDWTGAGELLLQAQRVDPQNSQVQKMLTTNQERLRQQQQKREAVVLRNQADEAFMEQRYDDALRILERAIFLDGTNADLRTFRDLVSTAKERATAVRRLYRAAQFALDDEDFEEALRLVEEALRIDPQDTPAKALKAIIEQRAEEKERQEQVRKLLAEAQEQLDAGNITAAITILKKAKELFPTSSEVDSAWEQAIAAQEQEKRRAENEALRLQIDQQIKNALDQGDNKAALALAEEGIRKFPKDPRFPKIKAVVRNKVVSDQISAANSLADAGEVRRAVALLENALQKAQGNTELESLRATFLDRLEGQRRQQATESVLAEGERILRERGAGAAFKFLSARANEFSDSQAFRELYDSVRERAVFEELDRRIAGETHPALQCQLAEEVLRQNPSNHWIEQRVADLRQRKDQVNAAVVRAQGLQRAKRLPEAMELWRQLSKAYPQVQDFDDEVRRIAGLMESGYRTDTPAPERCPQKDSEDTPSATESFNPAVPPDVKPPKTDRISKGDRPRKEPAPDPIAKPKKPALPRPDPVNLGLGYKEYVFLAAAVMVLVVVGYLILDIFIGGKKTVRITTDPADAAVTVGTQKCHAPCDLSLQVGPYELRAERDGYQPVTESVAIAADTRSLQVIRLKPIPPPPIVDQGTLIVHSNVDDAEVFVDGDLKGATKQNKYEGKFDVGSHQIILRKSKYKDSQPQTVPIAKGLQEIKIPLEKGQSDVGYIVITTNPGATVTIDGKIVEGRVSREGHRTQPTTPGNHSIQVQLDGYDPYNGQADVKLGEKFPINAVLKPKPKPPTPQPTIASFAANPPSIQQGQSAQLNWRTENADEVLIDGIPIEKSGSKQVTPTANTTYTLTAKGSGGASAQQSVAITVAAPPEHPAVKITQFKANPPSIKAGDSTTLLWITQNASDVSVDQGIGTVAAGDSQQVAPLKTTIYTLTAKGQGGDEKRQSVTVAVEPTPHITPPSSEAKQCIGRFQSAYQLKSIGELVKVWPSLAQNKEAQNKLKEVFKSVQAIQLQYQCDNGSPGPEDTAHFQCDETMVYTIDGKVQPARPPNHVEFNCKKTPGGWVVENRVFK